MSISLRMAKVGVEQNKIWRLAIKIAVLCALLVSSGCVFSEAETSGGSAPVDSSPLTIREEVTTSTVLPRTTSTSVSLGPLPEREWVERSYELVPIAELNEPTDLARRAGGDDLWITERSGTVRLIQRRLSTDNKVEMLKLMNTIVIDISDRVSTNGEGGLLGLDFSTNGDLLYLHYTDRNGDTVLAQYDMDILNADVASEQILFTVDQPYSNHNGGQLVRGPDGFLYLGLGDGGSADDPEGHGQNTQTYLGTIIRIDPSRSSEEERYFIPVDNPYVNDPETGLPEIWSWGLRNPWRFSFDADTGDLWIADVGQGKYEEINFLPAGNARAGRDANLGWNEMEGDEPFEGGTEPRNHVPPLFTYEHNNGRCSVTGGYVYRGLTMLYLNSVYIFSDYCSGEIFGLERLDDGRLIVANLTFDREPSNVIAFGQGPENELFVMEQSGLLSRIQGAGWRRETVLIPSDEAFPGGSLGDDVGGGTGPPTTRDTSGTPLQTPTTAPPTTPGTTR